jgi:hypothetical protein
MIVIASKPGQLANLLFVFGHFIAAAREHDLAIVNPAFDEYVEYFEATRPGFVARYPLRPGSAKGSKATRKLIYQLAYYLTRIVVRSPIKFPFIKAITLDWEDELELDDPEFLKLTQATKVILAQGWLFRANASFAKHADAIRDFFRPVAPVQANVDALIKRARANRDVLVGVHIRQGDYRTFQGGRFFHETEGYVQLMDRVRQFFPGKQIRFLICSNVKQEEEKFAAFDFTFGTNHFVEDMYAFAQCDYLVGPPSTYTMWASFYGRTPLFMVDDLSREIDFSDSMFK